MVDVVWLRGRTVYGLPRWVREMEYWIHFLMLAVCLGVALAVWGMMV